MQSQLTKLEVSKIIGLGEHKYNLGPMTDSDILNALYAGDLFISSFESANVTPVGYNFQPSEIIISTTNGLPLRVIEKGSSKYVVIKANETVLIRTKESVCVGNNIMGTFHSRVKIVSQGFGHISTTLDPGWKGPLLIAISNPLGKKLKLYLQEDGKQISFVTLILYRLCSVPNKEHDNPPNRTDILEKYLREPNWVKRILLRFVKKQYKELVSTLKNSNLNGEAVDVINCKSLDELNDCIKEIRSQYEKSGTLCDYNLYTRLNTLIIDQRLAPGISGVCAEIPKILYSALTHFDPYISSDKPRDTDFQMKFIEYLEKCQLQVRTEKQSKIWSNAYDDSIKNANSGAFSSMWMHLVMNPMSKTFIRVICNLAIFTSVIIALYYLGDNNDNIREYLQDIYVPLAIAVIASITSGLLLNTD